MSDAEIVKLFRSGTSLKEIARESGRTYLEVRDMKKDFDKGVITDVEILDGNVAELSSMDKFSNDLEETGKYILGRIKSLASDPDITPKELSGLTTSVTQLKSTFFAKDTNINIGAVIAADKLNVFKGMLGA